MIETLNATQHWVRTLQQKGRKIVFTNGCFDVLHAGHVTYLTQAKALGDVLVVGLNSDASVRRLKGDRRPIQTQEERAMLLDALKVVDAVVIFEEDTPLAVLDALRPDIHTKGGDYQAERLPEYPLIQGYGGRVEILPFVTGKSTSGIVERIVNRYANK